MYRNVAFIVVVCSLASAPAMAQVATTGVPVPVAANEPPQAIPVVDLAAAQPPLQPPRLIRDATPKRPAALVPMYASLATLNGLDIVTTSRAISSGAGEEANPVMRGIVGSRAAFIAVKAGSTLGSIWLAERMRKRHPARALVFMAASNGVVAAIVAHNWRVAR